MNAKTILTNEEQGLVEEAIAAAERGTSAEIRVAFALRRHADPLIAAASLFHKLGMDKTRERNGVLILVLTAERKFAVLGDEGIHRVMGQEGWDGVRDRLAEAFRAGHHAAGLVAAVGEVGRTLSEHFPRRHDDTDELSNAVIVGE